MYKKIIDSLDFKKQCSKYGVGLWQCPQFLFLVMGSIIALAIIVTNILSRRYIEPHVVALIVLVLAAILFVISYTIISSFDRIVRSAQAKSEFVSMMSHRLRTPLSAIKWQLDLLLEGNKDESFLGLKAQNEKMIWIVNNLIDLNHTEDETLFFSPSQFSLKKTIEEIVSLHDEISKSANLSFVLNLPDDIPNVLADKSKIKNIIYHFVDNAIRYSTRKGRITITLEKIPGAVRCLVADEGVGIPQKESKYIFTKFFRGKEILYYQTEGIGIGLFISKKIIEKSNGEIGFTSIEGRGSTFWFTLPIAKQE